MKKLLSVLLLLVVTAAMMNSCKKDDSDDSSDPGTTSGNQVNASISGMVLDESANPLIGVTVTANGNSATTDLNGIFLLKGNVTDGRCILQLAKAGFLSRQHALVPKTGAVNYVRIILQDEPVAQFISTASGGTVSLGAGGSVIFPSNAFVIEGSTTPYNGTVSIVANHLSPGDPNFSLMIPGGDMAGKNQAGESVSLYSFGMTSATLTGSSGEELQLAAGMNATINFPIASSQLGSAPATIPLWYFDEADALWKEEGQAIKVGNNYVGNVTHFSTWNCDYSGPRAYVNGRVVDCEGTPLANITVTINGGVTVTTDGNGNYTTWVPSGWALTFEVLPQGVFVQGSQLENVAPLTTGQTYTVPDLVVPCGSRINGRITGCNGENTSGTAALKFNDEVVSFQYTSDGNFSVPAAENTMYTMVTASPNGLTLTTVTSIAASDTLEIGPVQVCNEMTSTTSFTVDGLGYQHVAVNLLDEDQNQSVYYINSDYTFAYVQGFSTLGPCYLNISFEGNQPVTQDLTTLPGDSVFSLNFNGTSFSPSHQTNNHFILNITEYGAVGDSIKGTFSGDLYSYLYLQNVAITNGKFAFVRMPDQ